MVSKTSLQTLIKEFQANEVRKSLDTKPELLNFRDPQGRNWLHLCASVNVSGKPASHTKKSVQLAGVLLDKGIEIDAPGFTEGDWHATPLWYAIARGQNYSLAVYLLAQGATPEHCLWAAAYYDDVKTMKLLITSGATINAVAEEETPFLHAVKFSRFKAAEYLLSAGADPDYRDVKGMTALHYMLKKSCDPKRFDMMVKYQARGDIEDKDGRTAKQILKRKRDAAFHAIADKLTT